jgi:hypothetical protein
MIALTLAACAEPSATVAPQRGPGAAGGPAGRCASLLAQFDEVIAGSFDAWPLLLEDDDLAEARGARDQAQAECTAGRYGFGIPLIESALRQIGIVPPPEEN